MSPEEMYELADEYYDGINRPADIDKAVVWFTKAAEAGYPEAQYRLGELYYFGFDVPADRLKSLKWFCRCAESGYIGYYSGTAGLQIGVPSEDPGSQILLLLEDEANDWLSTQQTDFSGLIKRTAMASFSAYDMLCIGAVYQHGFPGIPADMTKAIFWWKNSAEAGLEVAAHLVNIFGS